MREYGQNSEVAGSCEAVFSITVKRDVQLSVDCGVWSVLVCGVWTVFCAESGE